MRSSTRCASGTHSKIQECCGTSNPCDDGQGDCDKDSECSGNLICGKNNCNRSQFPSNKTDCCASIGAVLNQGSDDPNFVSYIWALVVFTYVYGNAQCHISYMFQTHPSSYFNRACTVQRDQESKCTKPYPKLLMHARMITIVSQ